MSTFKVVVLFSKVMILLSLVDGIPSKVVKLNNFASALPRMILLHWPLKLSDLRPVGYSMKLNYQS